jgi:hypothetical protein
MASTSLPTNGSAVTEARFHRRRRAGARALARFRYSRLKEAARGCGGRGPLCKFNSAKEPSEDTAAGVWGSAPYTRPCGDKSSAAKKASTSVVEEAGRRGSVRGRSVEVRSVPRHEKVSNWRESFSCRGRDHRWRTKLDFGGSEPFDDLHGAAAFRAAPKIGRVLGGARGCWSCGCGAEPSR